MAKLVLKQSFNSHGPLVLLWAIHDYINTHCGISVKGYCVICALMLGINDHEDLELIYFQTYL